MATKKTARKKPAKRKKVAGKKTRKKHANSAAGKQDRFVAEYLVDLNATKAAIRAGYSAKTAGAIGHKLLKKADIQARVTAKRDEAMNKVDLSAANVIAELHKVGFANLGDYMRITPDGDPAIDLSNMTREQSAALQELTVEDFTDGRGKDARDVRRVRLKMLSKLDALEKLGKYLGLFSDSPPIAPGTEVTEIRRTIVHPTK